MLVSFDNISSSEDNTTSSNFSCFSTDSSSVTTPAIMTKRNSRSTNGSISQADVLDSNVFMNLGTLGKRKVIYVTRSMLKQMQSNISNNNNNNDDLEDDNDNNSHHKKQRAVALNNNKSKSVSTSAAVATKPSTSSSSSSSGRTNSTTTTTTTASAAETAVEDTTSTGRPKLTRSPSKTLQKNTKPFATTKWSTDEEAKQLILQYSIDPYDYSHEELIELSVCIFRYYALMDTYHFTTSMARKFFFAVQELYSTSNDFHNFRHAFGVMHMCFQILIHGGDQFLTTLDVFAVLIAAICHDVGHPGNNNAFELAIQSDVSKKYADPGEICVLEKYHASETQSLLTRQFPHSASSENNVVLPMTASSSANGGNNSSRSSGNSNNNIKRESRDILNDLSAEEKEQFFHQVRFIILGTDMAKHTALVEEAHDLIGQILVLQKAPQPKRTLKSVATSIMHQQHHVQTKDGVSRKPLLDADVRLALTRIIVHTADIGAQTQAIHVAEKWAERVYNEFRSQVSYIDCLLWQ